MFLATGVTHFPAPQVYEPLVPPGLALTEGLLLATDWRGARRLTLWRMRRGDTTGASRGAPQPVSCGNSRIDRTPSIAAPMIA